MGMLRDVLSWRDIIKPRLARVTWITHSLSCVIVTVLVPVPQKVLVAWLCFLVYCLKEAHDKVGHLRVGDYDTPDASGVAPRSDYVGDLLGPTIWALGVTYGWLVWG